MNVVARSASPITRWQQRPHALPPSLTNYSLPLNGSGIGHRRHLLKYDSDSIVAWQAETIYEAGFGGYLRNAILASVAVGLVPARYWQKVARSHVWFFSSLPTRVRSHPVSIALAVLNRFFDLVVLRILVRWQDQFSLAVHVGTCINRKVVRFVILEAAARK